VSGRPSASSDLASSASCPAAPTSSCRCRQIFVQGSSRLRCFHPRAG